MKDLLVVSLINTINRRSEYTQENKLGILNAMKVSLKLMIKW